MTIVLIALAMAGLLAAQAIYYVVLYQGQRKQSELKRRLRSLAKPGQKSLLRERRLAHNPGVRRLLDQIPGTAAVERLLLQTDLSWTVAQVVALSLGLAVAISGGLMTLLRHSPALGLIGVPVGLVIPLVILLRSRAQRNHKMSRQLPDALDMMVRSLRAGHGVSAGFKLVAAEMPMPIAMEFGRCFEEQQFGIGFRDSVRNMTERVPSNLDLKMFAVSIIIQHDTGGNLVEILDKIAYTVRERFKFYGKLRALTVEAKMSAYILSALPFLCAGAMVMLNPNYLKPLVTDPLGRLFIIGAFVLWGLGGLWMRKLAKVDF